MLQNKNILEVREGAYTFLHGTEISGTIMVSIVLCQVCCCEPIDIVIRRVRLIGQQDLTALREGIGYNIRPKKRNMYQIFIYIL